MTVGIEPFKLSLHTTKLFNSSFTHHHRDHPLLCALDVALASTTTTTTTTNQAVSQVLAQLYASGLVRHPLATAAAIKALSSRPSYLPLAISFFSSLPSPDAFHSNTILRSLLPLSPTAALRFLSLLVLPLRITPNHFTFPLLSRLFAALRLPGHAAASHSQALKLGFGADLYVRNSLIHCYSSLGDAGAARRVFDEACVASDVVTWNSMVDGYVKNGMVGEARRLFDAMPDRDVVSWNAMVAGHAAAGDISAARELFEWMPERDVVSWNTMIDGYARAGELVLARELFNSMPVVKNVVSWNIVLALYARVNEYRECLRLFDGMVAAGCIRPNEATFVSVLTACAHLGDLERGRWVHSLIENNAKTIELDVLLSTALLTMYAKCGVLEMAEEIFERMPERSVVSWNSMIIGHGMHGGGHKALEMFMEMERTGPKPDENTFICILSSCAHSGMLMEGWWCFDRMIRVHSIEPKVDHFGCMVDLLGRAGLLKDSEELLKKLPAEPGAAPLWGALLSASRTHSNAELGEIVGKKLIKMEPRDVGPYVLLSNIYAAEGRWEDVERVREMMKENDVQKHAGVSLVGEHFGSDSCFKDTGSSDHKRIVYFMLSEMGAHLKSSCRKIDDV